MPLPTAEEFARPLAGYTLRDRAPDVWALWFGPDADEQGRAAAERLTVGNIGMARALIEQYRELGAPHGESIEGLLAWLDVEVYQSPTTA